MQSIEYIHVDQAKLEQMQKGCWCELEQPLVAVPLEFKTPTSGATFTSGILMITRGAHYLFKTKLFGGVEFFQKFNLLHVQILHCSPNQMTFDLESGPITLKTEDVSQIAYATMNVLKSATYGLTAIQSLRVDSTVPFPDVNISERPADALKWRAIFLAHYYDIKGEQLYTVDYFNKWEGKKHSTMIIGPSLHPGNFANAFGHAIAWETMLSTVVFQGFAPSKFPKFFDSLVDNAYTISRIAFTDYTNVDRIPQFSGLSLQRSSVKQYNFMRVLAPIVLAFFEKSGHLPQIESLVLHKVKLINTEFTQLADYAVNNNAMKNNLKYFEITRTTIQNFPTKDLSRMVGAFSRLESIALRGLNGDGLRFINAVNRSKAPVKVIHANMMNFRQSFEKCVLPETLLHIDVSFSNFNEEAFSTFLVCLTRNQARVPFIVQALNLTLKKESYYAVQQIQFGNCLPNIAEFDFSNNKIPAEESRALFAFLFTQRNMRLLSLNNVTTNNPVELLKNVMTLVTSLKIPGIELSGFDTVTLSQFVQALVAQNLTHFRRIGFLNSKLGSQGLAAFAQLVNISTDINEIAADGAQPETQDALFQFWKVVAQKNTIVAADFPEKDLQTLGLITVKMPRDIQDMFKKVKELALPSTAGKRDAFNILELKQNQQPTATADIFKLCVQTPYEDTENDFATKDYSLDPDNQNEATPQED